MGKKKRHGLGFDLRRPTLPKKPHPKRALPWEFLVPFGLVCLAVLFGIC